MAGILSGKRVADFTEYIAGPYCTQILADLGAEVTKIEPPGGDHHRASMPVEGIEGRGFLQVNRSKRSFVVDLKRAEGQALVHRLIAEADVAVVAFRPHALKRLRIDYATLSAINPRLVYGAITGFGSDGPYAHRGAFDMVAQAASGMLVHEGTFCHETLGVTSTSISDYSAAVYLTIGILGALLDRERTGRGQKVETNLLDAGIAAQYRPLQSVERVDEAPRQEFVATLEALRESEPDIVDLYKVRADHLGSTTRNIYWRAYATKDGFIALACLNNVMRRKLRDILGVDDPAVDGPTYAGSSREETADLVSLVKPMFRQRTSAEWYDVLDQAGVPVGPVNAPEQVFDDPQVRHNGSILSVQHEKLGELRMPAHPVRYSESEVAPATAPPMLGANTRETLEALGYDDASIRRLAAEGVVYVPDVD